jgi:hypothetical protein
MTRERSDESLHMAAALAAAVERRVGLRDQVQ